VQTGPLLHKACMYVDALSKNEHCDLDDIPYALDDAVQVLQSSSVSAER
jgi:hypothetical protein